MISLRYHIVSIVAVFLALAVGVLMGTTVVNQGVISQLNKQTDRALRNASSSRKTVAQLQGQIAAQSSFIRAVEPNLVKGALVGTQVLMVTVDGVDPAEVDGVRKVLEDSGASLVAVLVATPKMALTDPAARAELSTILDIVGAVSAEQLATRSASEIGARLANGLTPADTGPDVLQELVTARFLALRPGTSPTAAQIGGTDQSIVLLSGNATTASSVDPKLFLTPLSTSVLQVDPGRPVVVAETTQAVTPYIDSVRSDPSLHARLVTVDDADTMAGQVAVALGLHELQLSPGEGGDYGVKCSCAPIPTIGP